MLLHARNCWRSNPARACRLVWLLVALSAIFQLAPAGLASKVTYQSGPHGVGPYNIPPPSSAYDITYLKGRTCGDTPNTRAWDKQLGAFNDSSYNPSLKPITEVRTRYKASIQTVWGSTVGPEHGYTSDTRKQDAYRLLPGEVINKVEFWAYPDLGFIGNITFYTNRSREVEANWTLRKYGNELLVQAMPPDSTTWTGPPIAGSWYLAYISADILGFCMPFNKSNPLTNTSSSYWITPVFYFMWAADVAASSPSPTPSPAASPIPTPLPSPTPSPAPGKATKKTNIAVIAGAIGGAAFLVVLAALVWVWLKYGTGLASVGGAKGGGGGPAAAAALGVGAAAGASSAAPGGAGYAKDVEAGPLPGAAAAAAAGAGAVGVPVAGAVAGRDLPTSAQVAHTTAHPPWATPAAAAYHAPQPSTHSNTAQAPAEPLPPSSPFHDQTNPLYATTVSPRPSAASSLNLSFSTLPPSASAEQPILGKGATPMAATVAGSTVSSTAGGPASTMVKGSRRPAAMMAPGSGMSTPGVMLHGGGGGGGAVAVGPMAAVGAAGVAVMGTVLLAREILDAGDRVVANHARCLRLTSRIHSILPLLNCLHTHLEKEAATKGQQSNVDLQHLINNMNTVFSDVRDCINRWCGGESAASRGVLVQVLRNLMVSKRFEDEFLDLNERLSGCYQDLILALNIKRTVGENDPARLKKQHEEDVAADLKGVAEELSTAEGEQAWNSLPPEERATIREAFFNYGLNFNALMTQVRKNAIGERVKDLIIPWSEITITAQIGSGGYGTVYRGTWQDIDVAVKKLQLVVVTERAKRELSHEAYVMSLLRHPNVATSYGMVLEQQNCALVMRYYEKGTLLELLHDDAQPLTLRRKLQLASDVAKGMAYLHNRPTDPVIHGDLKPSNLLIDDDGRVVITDFGLSKVSTLTLTTRPSSSGMSVTYTAPEILADPTGKRTAAADVYAYGLVLFEIFTRGLPFECAADVMAVVQYVLGGGRPKVAGAEFEELRVPKEVVQLMQECWQQVPQARPTFTEIVDKLRVIDC